MNRDSLYAFYGTLRRGMENHHLLGSGAQYLQTVKLPGYKLYSLVEYPYAVKTGNRSDGITAELFYLPDLSIQHTIHEMELEVGYYYHEVPVEGKMVGIYLFHAPAPDDIRITSGDWARYIVQN